jgi:hypothetical protein
MTNLDALWVKPSDIDASLDLETIDPEDTEALMDYEAALAACEFASQTLWALSGRKFHTASVTERYVVDRSWIGSSVLPLRGLPVYDSQWGVWVIDPQDWNGRKIKLTGTPVNSVAAITSLQDNSPLLPSEYTIFNRSILVLENPNARGIEISYSYGQAPPTAGKMAAKQLATQFFYLWSGREEMCALPERVTQVSREQVSWTILDNQSFLDELKTGIYAVDLFLRSVNPDKARAKAKVFSVDVPRGRRRSL